MLLRAGKGLPQWLSDKEFTCKAGDAGDTTGLFPGWGRSPGGEHSNPFQCSCLGQSHGQRGLAGYRLWVRTELDTTEAPMGWKDRWTMAEG